MRFSIIMPLYNKAPYVRKAVESVVGQTYAEWELWVVDDGSTDGSGDIVKAFTDNRIHLLRQENAGVSVARNNGVAASHGEYLCFLDADDWWEPTFLEEMAGLIERHPDAGIYGSGYYIVKNGKKRIAPIGVDEDFSEGEINYCRVYAKTLCMPLWTGAVCMPRTMFNEAGGFPPYITLGEDFLLWIHIALKHKVVLLNKPLSNYYQDSNPAFRGISRLHIPKQHFLWNLDKLNLPVEAKTLLDKLTAYGLVPYYLSHQYHEATLPLLKCVDWDTLPVSLRKTYYNPLFFERIKHVLLTTVVLLRDRLKRVYRP